MKTKTGFISNSSSCSFILSLKNKPKNEEEWRELLFGNKRHVVVLDYNELEGKYCRKRIRTIDVARYIVKEPYLFADIKKISERIDFPKDIDDVLQFNNFRCVYEHDALSTDHIDIAHKHLRKYIYKHLRKWIAKNPGHLLSFTLYSWEDCYDALIRYNALKSIPHIITGNNHGVDELSKRRKRRKNEIKTRLRK